MWNLISLYVLYETLLVKSMEIYGAAALALDLKDERNMRMMGQLIADDELTVR